VRMQVWEKEGRIGLDATKEGCGVCLFVVAKKKKPEASRYRALNIFDDAHAEKWGWTIYFT